MRSFAFRPVCTVRIGSVYIGQPRILFGDAIRRLDEAQCSQRVEGESGSGDKGRTTAHVRIEIAAGTVVTGSITNEAVDELQLKAGHAAYAVVKASDVMVARD